MEILCRKRVVKASLFSGRLRWRTFSSHIDFGLKAIIVCDVVPSGTSRAGYRSRSIGGEGIYLSSHTRSWSTLNSKQKTRVCLLGQVSRWCHIPQWISIQFWMLGLECLSCRCQYLRARLNRQIECSLSWWKKNVKLTQLQKRTDVCWYSTII